MYVWIDGWTDGVGTKGTQTQIKEMCGGENKT